ncbi:Modification methylase DpnIIA [compost metagenome]
MFADPPYTVQHNNNGFIKYNEKIFSWEDQVRLAECLAAATRRGACVVSTNANHVSVRDLYTTRGFTCRVTSRFSAISGGGDHRGQYEELIITSKS